MTYPKVPFGRDAESAVSPRPSFPRVEREVLGFWGEDGTFRASVDATEAGADGSNEFVFYDGPPFANGLPHYGHLLTGYVKDAVPRYRTMRGQRVERRFGWDCHGLPAEVEAEKQLGICSKSEIEAMGVAEFNRACRESVLRYTDEWQDYVTRQARWVDFDNDYKTLDAGYMESVMWAFKTLWDKGLVYESFRVLWYCWRCETPLSNTETRMDDVYRQRQDPAVTVGLRLRAPDEVFDGALALVWTTTPWTLPSNLAAAVHPEVDYVLVESRDGERYVLAEARLAAYAKELGADIAERVIARFAGTALLDTRYEPPFRFFLGRDNAHHVLSADYVTTEDGTGIVHIAPAFGEDDKVVTDAAEIEPVVPVDVHGRFTAEVAPYAGIQVFEANKQIIRDLKDAGLVLRHETYEHPYPHCWRCDNALMQRAVSSWFVAVSQFRDRMVEVNRRINWVPDHIREGQFGRWLENARDWNVSRNRYWGSPIPVWVSDDPTYPRTDVYGSLDELERDFGRRPRDLHRPAIDELTRPNPDDPTGRSAMRRVPEVLDCWFESGSMPFAQVHYPFESAEWFERHNPGDFIVEYNGQTRGWFYTLHVLATALFDRPAVANVVAHGIVLGHDGMKMSKSKRNYPDVNEVFDCDGSDAMRWFLLSSSVLRGGDLVVTEKGIRDAVCQAVLPLWNSWYFLTLYANAEYLAGEPRVDSEHVLDRYVLAKARELVTTVQSTMDEFDLAGACASVRDFLGVLTNWYVRRSRERFWSGDQAAIDTLHTVLEVTSRVVAPLLPLTAEAVWRGLTGGRSVHLERWPDAEQLPDDPALVAAMDRVRQVCSSALALRKSHQLRVRLPLAKLVIAAPEAESLREFLGLVRDEINVKDVELTTDVEAHGRFEVAVNARVAGPRLGGDVQKVIKAIKAGEWTRTARGTVVAAGIELLDGEFTERLVSPSEGAGAIAAAGDGLVVLDTTVTPELASEGLARDVIRVVQQARREADFEVSDHVRVAISAADNVLDAVVEHRDAIAGETLATEVEPGSMANGFAGSVGDGTEIAVSVSGA